jgi:hypothetical protein
MAFRMLYILGLLLFLLNACNERLASSPETPSSEIITYKNMEMTRADSSEISPAVRLRYRTDSEIITALLINEENNTQIELPSELIDMLYNGLLHIYKSDIEEAQEVTKDYEIHRTVLAGASRRLYLRIDKDQGWARAWLNDILITGNAGIDQLIKEYNLQLIDAIELFTEPDVSAKFKTKKPYNQFALASLFNSRDDVENAGANINIADGDNIEVAMGDNHIQYLFSDGFGDCFAGCIKHYYWSFNVLSDGRVEFVEEYGSPFE